MPNFVCFRVDENRYFIINAVQQKKRRAPSSAAVNWPHGAVTLIYITEGLMSPGEVRTSLCWAQSWCMVPQSSACSLQRWRKTPRAVQEASGRARPSKASTGCPPARRAALLVRPWELVWSASRREGERRAGEDFQNSIPALERKGWWSYILPCHPSSAFWLRQGNLSASALFDSRYYRCCHGNDLCKN